MTNQSNSKEDAYLDRNLAVLALATMARQQGYQVGVKKDPNEPDWPVIMIDLPTGQVSWHIPKSELSGSWSEFASEWDGHTLEQKRNRIKQFIINDQE